VLAPARRSIGVAPEPLAPRAVGPETGQLGGVEPLFDGVELRGDAILFRLQEFEWYRSGVVGFEELASLVEELSLAGDESGAVADVVLAE